MPVSTWFRKQADWEDRVITIADIAIDPSSLGESVVQQRYEAPLPDSATPVIELGLAAIKIDKIPPALLEIAGTHGAFLWIRYGYDAQGELLEAEQIDAYAASAPESRYIAPDRIQGSKPITVTLTRSGASIDQLAIGS